MVYKRGAIFRNFPHPFQLRRRAALQGVDNFPQTLPHTPHPFLFFSIVSHFCPGENGPQGNFLKNIYGNRAASQETARLVCLWDRTVISKGLRKSDRFRTGGARTVSRGSYVSASSRSMAGRNCRENMTAVVVTARASATGSARNTAKTLSAKKWGRI